MRATAPDGIGCATDLFGTETAETALASGAPAERVSTIAAGPDFPGGVRATGGVDAQPEDHAGLGAARDRRDREGKSRASPSRTHGTVR
ncbi:hypothetical protein [Streptomyces griseoluteus]|uniref:hypothetical protein n=1 Tax=Streptomyces griseoluteus TaxID=29306 RepID=UPI0036E265BF